MEYRLAEAAPQVMSTSSHLIEFSAREAPVAATLSPAKKPLIDERLRLQVAVQRIDAGYLNRCVRCGRDFPRARPDQEPDALTDGDGRPPPR